MFTFGFEANMNSSPAESGLKNGFYYDKRTADIIKGIALIMMFIHHFLTYPEWHSEIIEYPFWDGIFSRMCSPMRGCVGIFALLTGYSVSIKLSRTDRKKGLIYLLKKIRDIFVVYLVFFIPFELIAYTVGGKAFEIKSFVLEIFALSTVTMKFCWYVVFYCLSLLLLWIMAPLLNKGLGRGIFWGIFFAQAVLLVVVNRCTNDYVMLCVRNLSNWFILMSAGYLIAGYGTFQKYDLVINGSVNDADSKDTKKAVYKVPQFVVSIIVFFISLFAVYFWPNSNIGAIIPTSGYGIDYTFNMQVIYIPVLVFSLIQIVNFIREYAGGKFLHGIGTGLEFIGKHCLHMWFCSCIFFGEGLKNIFMKVLYLPRIPVLVVIWGTVLCLAVSVPAKLLTDKILKNKEK